MVQRKKRGGWDLIGSFCSLLVLALVGVTFYQVFARYVLTRFDVGGINWLQEVLNPVFLQELEWHLFSLIFLLGAGFTLRRDGHVRVDVFFQKYSQKTKRRLALGGYFLLLLPFGVWVGWSVWPDMVTAFQTMEGSPNPGGIPFRFFIKGMVFLGMGLLLWEGGRELVKSQEQ